MEGYGMEGGIGNKELGIGLYAKIHYRVGSDRLKKGWSGGNELVSLLNFPVFTFFPRAIIRREKCLQVFIFLLFVP
jgi:hypothetical protein